MQTPENTVEDPDNPEQANEGDTQLEYYSDQLNNPNIGAVTKKFPLRTHVSVGLSDNPAPVRSCGWINRILL